MTELDARRLADESRDLDTQALLALVLGRYGRRVALASSLGAEDQVLTDMLWRISPSASVFTLDTGRLPQETYDAIDAVRSRYGLAVEVLFPRREAVEALVAEGGVNLFYRSVEARKHCCHVRKVEPLGRKLATLDAWFTGLRREQAVTRGEVARVEWDAANGLIKINPLADWTGEQVWDYVRTHDVPVNALHAAGYPSIGCLPCTRAVAPGEDIRAGRWWWEQPEHKECGLHPLTGRPTRMRPACSD